MGIEKNQKLLFIQTIVITPTNLSEDLYAFILHAHDRHT